MQHVFTYFKEHHDEFLEQLFDLLRIPSISADPAYTESVAHAAAFVAKHLSDSGVATVEVHPTEGHPIVYAEHTVDDTKPTVLIYGHYDVQPVDPIDLWHSDPFDPVVRDEKIYARGACDDKGQMFMHLAAIRSLFAVEGNLPCNIKCIFEGEEEVGSNHLETFIAANQARLSSDMALISDTSLIANDIASLTVGLRGISYLEVLIHGPNADLHSGVFGGASPNPATILTKLLASLKDEHNHITVEGFYDDVVELDATERALLQSAPYDATQAATAIGVSSLITEDGYTGFEATRIRPSFDINGLWSGYQGEGAKTIIPSYAGAKISFRLVPNQNGDDIANKVEQTLRARLPEGVTMSITKHHGGNPSVIPQDSPYYRAAAAAMKETMGMEPIPDRCGGSIPVVHTFSEYVTPHVILMGFGLDTDNIHSPNEHFGIWNFNKGVETILTFYKHLSTVDKQI